MATQRIFFRAFILILVASLFSSLGYADDAISDIDNPQKLTDLERCDWLVTYRNRTYDLAPLTRGALDRPLEGDIRSILRRSPEAGVHLDEVERQARLSRVHSIVGSAGVTAFLLTRLFRNDPRLRANGQRLTLDIVGLGGLVFFAKSALDANYATKKARTEMAAAVEVFNSESPHKIEPRKEEF